MIYEVLISNEAACGVQPASPSLSPTLLLSILIVQLHAFLHVQKPFGLDCDAPLVLLAVVHIETSGSQ